MKTLRDCEQTVKVGDIVATEFWGKIKICMVVEYRPDRRSLEGLDKYLVKVIRDDMTPLKTGSTYWMTSWAMHQRFSPISELPETIKKIN